jgi:hypothetical protein
VHERGVGAKLGDNEGDALTARILQEHRARVQALAVANRVFAFGTVTKQDSTGRRSDVDARETGFQAGVCVGWDVGKEGGMTHAAAQSGDC